MPVSDDTTLKQAGTHLIRPPSCLLSSERQPKPDPVWMNEIVTSHLDNEIPSSLIHSVRPCYVYYRAPSQRCCCFLPSIIQSSWFTTKMKRPSQIWTDTAASPYILFVSCLTPCHHSFTQCQWVIKLSWKAHNRKLSTILATEMVPVSQFEAISGIEFSSNGFLARDEHSNELPFDRSIPSLL